MQIYVDPTTWVEAFEGVFRLLGVLPRTRSLRSSSLNSGWIEFVSANFWSNVVTVMGEEYEGKQVISTGIT